jgi:hypothetical protein
MKPPTCKQIGCAGASCKHYKPTDKYPYYECQWGEDKKDKGEKCTEK